MKVMLAEALVVWNNLSSSCTLAGVESPARGSVGRRLAAAGGRLGGSGAAAASVTVAAGSVRVRVLGGSVG